MRTRNNKKLLLASTVHIPTTTHPTPHRWGWWGVPVVTAEGKRPDPSRTRKLSPPAPMVLRPTGRGRVGHRRNTRPPPPPHGVEQSKTHSTTHSHQGLRNPTTGHLSPFLRVCLRWV